MDIARPMDQEPLDWHKQTIKSIRNDYRWSQFSDIPEKN